MSKLIPPEISKQEEISEKSPKKSKLQDWWSQNSKKAREALIYPLVIIGFAYAAALFLGFKGYAGPINVLTNSVIGHAAQLLALIVAAVVILSIYLGLISWVLARKLFIVLGIILALHITAKVYFPGLSPINIPKVQAFRVNVLNQAANAGVRFQVSSSNAHIFSFSDDGKLTQTETVLAQGKKLPFVNEANIREFKEMKFMEVRYETGYDNKGEYEEKIGWVNLDDGVVVRKAASEDFIISKIGNDQIKITFLKNQPIKIADLKTGTRITYLQVSNPEKVKEYNPEKNISGNIVLNFTFKEGKDRPLMLQGGKGEFAIIQSKEIFSQLI